MKRKIINFLIVFFSFILGGTYLSNVTTNMTIAQVEIAYVESATLGKTVDAQGIVTGKQKVAVITESGLQIEALHVVQGENISQGEALFTISLEKLAEDILLLQENITMLDYQIKDAKSNRDKTRRDIQTTSNRAVEAYSHVIATESAKVDVAKKELDDAQKEYQEYISENPDSSETKEMLQLMVNDKEQSYTLALESQEISIYNAQLMVGDANVTISSDSTPEQLEITRGQSQRKLEKLLIVEEMEGVVISPKDGRLDDILVEVGSQTTEEPVMRIVDNTGGGEVTFQIAKNAADFVEIGNDVEVSLSGSVGMKERYISRVKSIGKEEDTLSISVDVSLEEFELGSTVEMRIVGEYQVYDETIPIGALHMESKNRYYVYGVKRNETIVGTELEVVKYPVEVLERNAERVAVQGVIGEVIVGSDRMIREGSKVREGN